MNHDELCEIWDILREYETLLYKESLEDRKLTGKIERVKSFLKKIKEGIEYLNRERITYMSSPNIYISPSKGEDTYLDVKKEEEMVKVPKSLKERNKKFEIYYRLVFIKDRIIEMIELIGNDLTEDKEFEKEE